MATIRVKAARDDGRVAFFEKNPEHPSGEVFVAGNGQVVEAGETRALKAAIRAGRLVTEQTTPVARKQTPPTQPKQPVTEGDESEGLAGYDNMTVDEAVAFARGLGEDERATLIEYERRNKNRRGVLDALGVD